MVTVWKISWVRSKYLFWSLRSQMETFNFLWQITGSGCHKYSEDGKFNGFHYNHYSLCSAALLAVIPPPPSLPPPGVEVSWWSHDVNVIIHVWYKCQLCTYKYELLTFYPGGSGQTAECWSTEKRRSVTASPSEDVHWLILVLLVLRPIIL